MLDLRIKLLMIFGFFSVFGFGQVINMDLPVLSPQSPTTNALGKYGEIQVNESTGTISPSIPLFEYYTGQLNLPITLQYSGNGVRVNQDPTWTGINWNLNPSGVITRIVKDKVDESPLVTKKFISEADLNLMSGSLYHERNSVWYLNMEQIGAAAVDSEADIFNYNFPGYSGSFFIDEQNIVHLIKYDKELAISFYYSPDNESEFVIKTPAGDTYLFGGPNASESSKTFVNIGAGSTASSDAIQNAFYLHQISFFNGGSVFFDYESYKPSPGGFRKIGIQESASYSSNEMPCNKTTRDLFLGLENLVKLKKIRSSFNNQYVEFENSSYGQYGNMNKLNNIFLKKSPDGEIVKRIGLKYLTINNEYHLDDRKFFLDKVEFYNGDNKFEYDYELTYNSPEYLPKKASFAQDDLGYYNGKDENTTLLPKTNNVNLNANCHFGLADREADFFSAKKGSLTRIKYPTGGYSDFEYELPYKGQAIKYDQSLSMLAYYNDPDRNYASSMHGMDPIGLHTYSNTYFPEGGDTPLVITNPATINFSLNVTAKGPFTHHNNVSISIINDANQVVWKNSITGLKITTTDNEIKYYSENYTFNLGPGSYVFRISVNLHSSVDPVNNYVIANAHCLLPNGLRDVYYPGLRTKKVTTYDNNSNAQITRYYYNERNKLTLGKWLNSPNYINVTRDLHSSQTYFVDTYNLSANDLTNMYDNDSGNVTYDVVTVSYGGDNFQNGGKEMHFNNNNNPSPLYYGHTYDLIWPEGTVGIPSEDPPSSVLDGCGSFVNGGTNLSYHNSTLWKEYYFDSNLKDLKKMVYNYEGTIDFAMNNFITYKYCNITNAILYMPYQTNSYKYRLISTETTDFNGSNENGIVTSTTNFYKNDKVSLPSEIKTANSAGDVKKTNIYYPKDISILSSFSDEDVLNITTLESAGKHNIAEVIKTQSFLNGSLLDTKQVSFKNFGGKILPGYIMASKGTNPLEGRVFFHSYSYGKPTSVSVADGAKTEYRYNSKQQVILKIENFDSSYTIEDGLNTSNPCYYQILYPLSMVTKYNYDDTTNNLISIVDPQCKTTYYEYDEFNKLRFIKDKDLNILQRYCYNYEGQGVDCVVKSNVAQSGTFTRNNCPIGAVGSSVVYTVPAGTYFSMFSQADANAQAQANVIANGQMYANNTGACAFASVAKTGSFTRNNCGADGTGSTITYTLIAGAATSLISQADADNKALILFNTNGQNWANNKGTCVYLVLD